MRAVLIVFLLATLASTVTAQDEWRCCLFFPEQPCAFCFPECVGLSESCPTDYQQCPFFDAMDVEECAQCEFMNTRLQTVGWLMHNNQLLHARESIMDLLTTGRVKRAKNMAGLERIVNKTLAILDGKEKAPKSSNTPNTPSMPVPSKDSKHQKPTKAMHPKLMAFQNQNRRKNNTTTKPKLQDDPYHCCKYANTGCPTCPPICLDIAESCDTGFAGCEISDDIPMQDCDACVE